MHIKSLQLFAFARKKTNFSKVRIHFNKKTRQCQHFFWTLALFFYYFFIILFNILLAMFFDGSFKKIWFVLGSYMAACLLVPVMCGYCFPKKISGRQFSFCVWCSALIVTVWDILPRAGFWAEVEGFYIGLLVNIIFLGIILLEGKYGKI